MTGAELIAAIRKNGISGLGTPIALMSMLGMMILPMPPFLLDMFFTFNISLSLIILLLSIYAIRPLDFSSFPAVLLIATLLRLALNVASTRVILIHGHEDQGGAAAGQVIKAFASVLTGDNITVGLVVFAILMIINFVVVTKGAGRIAEVGARFTLDALPGKQMAIDADLNAGMIDQNQARDRRLEVGREADFYGAMDGASKFVRGDAIAGMLILVINIIGGFAVGMLQHDLPFNEAARIYTLLTIGDGLVAQLPSLLLSTAAAIIVSRADSETDVGTQIMGQMFKDPTALRVTAGVMTIMGLVPGMPHFAFLTLAAATGGASYLIQKRQMLLATAEGGDGVTAPSGTGAQGALTAGTEGAAQEDGKENEVKELSWDDVKPVDVIGLEIGYRLIPLVDKKQNGQLMARLKGVRRKLSQEFGFLIPPVHIRDNLDLEPSSYQILLMGSSVGEAEVHTDLEMAINPGQVFGTLPGIAGKDPAFGLDAVWIEEDKRDHAQSLGYTVVDPSTVVATHLSQILQDHSHEILGHEEVQHLLDQLAKTAPKLVEGFIPDVLSLSVVVKVLQKLLSEQVPIKDMRTIIETMAEYGSKSQDPDVLVAVVRVALGRLILQNINGIGSEVPVMTLHPDLEQILQKNIQVSGDAAAGFEPSLAERLQASLQELTKQQELAGQAAILLAPAVIRPTLARFTRFSVPDLHVLSYQEIPDNKRIKVIGSVGQ